MTTPALSAQQQRLLRSWLPGYEVVADHSWGQTDTVVLRVRAGGTDLVVKAGGPSNHHPRREIVARRRWTGPWLRTGAVAPLRHASEEARLLVVDHLRGRLVQDDPDAYADPQTYRQAGRLLAALHGQASRTDAAHESAADARTLRWLEEDHRISPTTVARTRAAVATHDHDPVELVPTHGDWHTRNWLVHEGVVRVIDLGRADWRPAVTDLARLARREWEGRPDLEDAFLDGYGADPRRPSAWRATLLREAVGTAVWAYRVGDTAFEEQGHRMLAQALTAYP